MSRRRTRITGLLTLMSLFILTLPLRADNYAPLFPIFNAEAASCATGFTFNAAASNPYAQVLGFRSFVESNGLRYTDEINTNLELYPVINIAGIVSIGTTNNGGTANANWPIPAGGDVTVTVQVLRDNLYPISETRVVLDSCDGNVLSSESGAIDTIIGNSGFETAGSVDTLPAKWVTLVDNDKRVCNSTIPGIAHSGECAFMFKPGPGAKNKLSQNTLLDPIARPGDQLRLGTWVKASDLPVDNSVIIKIKFPTLEKIKQKITLPAGTYDYQYLSIPGIDISESPTKVSVIIQTKGTTGYFVIDDVLAQVAVGASGSGLPLSALPTSASTQLLPLPGGVQSSQSNHAGSISDIDLTHPLR